MTTIKTYEGHDIVVPDNVVEHELGYPQPRRKKHELTMRIVEQHGVRSVAEFNAGFGALTVDYRQRGIDVVLAVENDRGRYEALEKNVGSPPAMFTSCHHPIDPMPADLLDFDPYDYPMAAMIAQRRWLTSGRIVVCTVSSIPTRMRSKDPKHMSTVDRKFAGCLLKYIGHDGATALALIDWIQKHFGGVEVLGTVTTTAIDRIAVRFL